MHKDNPSSKSKRIAGGVLLWILVLFSVGCSSIQVTTPVLNEENSDIIASDVTRLYNSTYFADHLFPFNAEGEPENIFALEKSTTAGQANSKALVARDWSGTRYVVYAKSLGKWNYIVQISRHMPDGEVVHTLHRVTVSKEGIIGYDYRKLKRITSKDSTVAEIGSGVSIENKRVVFDEVASARHPDKILKFVGGISEHNLIHKRELVPEPNAEVVKAFWKKKQRDGPEQISKEQRENEDREPTE